MSGFSSSFTDAKEEYIPVSSSSSPSSSPSPFPLLQYFLSLLFFLGPVPSCCCVVIHRRSRIFVFTSLLHFYLKGNGSSSRSSPWKDRSVVVCVSVWHDRVRSLNRHPPPINRQPKDLKHKIKQEINPREERGEEKEEEIALWRPPIFFSSPFLSYFFIRLSLSWREKRARDTRSQRIRWRGMPSPPPPPPSSSSSSTTTKTSNKGSKFDRLFFLFLGSSSATWYTESLLRVSVFN